MSTTKARFVFALASIFVAHTFSPGIAQAQSLQSPSAAGLNSDDLLSFGYSRIKTDTPIPNPIPFPGMPTTQKIITDAYGPFLSLGNHGLSVDMGFVASHLKADSALASASHAYALFFGLGFADEVKQFPVEVLPEPIRLNIYIRPHIMTWFGSGAGYQLFGGGEAGVTADIKAPMPSLLSMLSITAQPRFGVATPQWHLWDSEDRIRDHPTYSPWLVKVGMGFILNWREDNPTP
ncbi:hypothetical protein KAI87_11440, partial [Myxococcota bacterium]|nr:hypothetical protein [Myxococcota bacterium]